MAEVRSLGVVPARFKGWLDFRADSPVEIEVNDDLAREFMASSYYDPEGMLRRQLPLWLASKDGKNIAWDPRDIDNEDAFEDLIDRIWEIERNP